MEITRLGNSDLQVPRICVGCMSFGQRGTMHDWTLGPEETELMVRRALDLGMNFFDTANQYSAGTSEEYLGRALKNAGARDRAIIATKVFFNEGHLSREAILREVEGSLRRLQTDYIDLYIIHRFDYATPIEETMETLDGLVRAGKVRALGASAMFGYQFFNMQLAAQNNGWTPFCAMENHYNLIYREDEREMIPICRQWNTSLIPYSPLAAGHLTRACWEAETLRAQTDKVAHWKYDKMRDADVKILARVAELAEKHACKMVHIALAWLWARGAASPIIGATTVEHLEEAAAAEEIRLDDSELAYLEELYLPHPITGARTSNP